MMICIYCRRDSSKSVSVPHAIPEALRKNDNTLPIGMICDPCNAYFGANLEPALIAHPMIAFAIQYAGTPGKRGKSRSEIGKILYQPADDPGALLRGPIRVLSDVTTTDGVRHLKIALRPDPSFKMLAFRRALHYVAFNVMAMHFGADYVLEKRWDTVRRYIKAPMKGGAWGFAQRFPQPGLMRDVVSVTVENSDGFATLNIFGSCFVVDLNNSGGLEAVARIQAFEFVEPKINIPTTLVIDAMQDHTEQDHTEQTLPFSEYFRVPNSA